jgi:hypothetical protein
MVVNKTDIITQIRSARADLLNAIEGLTPDAMLRVGVVGLWSVKDLLAHLTAWQSELVTALAGIAEPKRVPHIVNIEDIDEWNLEQYRVNVRRDLDAVLEDFHGVHKHLVKMVEGMDDKTLNDVRRFRWMEGEPLWYLIAENGFWHEKEHADHIREWRATNGL